MKTKGLLAMVANRLNAREIYTRPAYWNAKADEWGVKGASGWINESLNDIYHERELALLTGRFPEVDGLDVLDAGCGTGRLSRYFARRGARVTGIDFSESAIAIARSHPGEGSCTFRVQSVIDLEDDASFDVAITFGVLCVACRDLNSLRKAIGNLYRALRPGGRLFLAEPLHRGPLGLSLRASWREVRAVVERAGFASIEVDPLHFWPVSRPLSYLPLPRSLTRPLYRLGDAAFRLSRSPSWGDYKIVDARRPAL